LAVVNILEIFTLLQVDLLLGNVQISYDGFLINFRPPFPHMIAL